MLALSDTQDLGLDILNEVYTGAPAHAQLSLAVLTGEGCVIWMTG